MTLYDVIHTYYKRARISRMGRLHTATCRDQRWGVAFDPGPGRQRENTRFFRTLDEARQAVDRHIP